jgi:excisionase family DNA binding protein
MILTEDDLNDLLDLNEAARRLRIHRHTLDRWIKAGRLDTVKLGGRRYVPRRSLLALVNDGIERKA